MVNYAGGDPIFDEEDIFEPVDVTTGAGGFPTVLPSSFFPEKPTLSGISALEQFAPLLLDEESYLKRFEHKVY